MKKNATLTNGQQIEMRLSEDLDEITFWQNGKQLSGEFEFKQDEFNDSRFLLSRMYCPVKKQGLGRQALEFFIEMTDGVIWTRPNDGQPIEDGSHLTEDAPSFVRAMQKHNLIEDWDNGMYDYDDEY